MGAEIRSFRRKLFPGDLPVFRQLLLPLIEDPSIPARVADAAAGVLVHLDGQTVSFNRREFLMLFPSQQRAVARMLRGSSRPAVANELWAVCFENMTREGYVNFDRAFFAKELGVEPEVVSRLMLELVRFEALLRQGTRRRYRYYLNPNVGTKLGLGKALDEAQASHPALQLVPPGEVRRRSAPVRMVEL